MMGSPLYMSPEQMRASKDVDARADIWALGVILFELIAGQPPFQSDSLTGLVLKVNGDPAPPVRRHRPDVPAALEEIIFKCLEKDREHRYRDVAELALALLPFAPAGARASVERISGIIRKRGLAAAAPTGGAFPGAPPSPPTPATVNPVGRTMVGSPTSKVAIGAGISGVVAVIAVVGSLVFLERTHRDGPPPAATHAASSIDPAKPADTSTPPPSKPAASVPIPSASTAQDPPAMPDAARIRPAVARPTGLQARTAGSSQNASTTTHPPSAAAAVPPPQATTRNCNPPYVIDAAVDRQYKPECL
jgi:serine/threonine protein kinase